MRNCPKKLRRDKRKKSEPLHFYQFDNLSELQDTVTPEQLEDRGLHRDYWIGRKFKDGDDCHQALNELWDKGMSMLDKCRSKLEQIDMPTPESIVPRLAFNEYDGGFVDFDRLRAGQDFWMAPENCNSKSPRIITLACDMGGNCNATVEEIAWRGVAAVALTEILEKAGYRVELFAYNFGTNSSKEHVFQTICLKRSGEPLDVGRVINGMSSWILRTWVFAHCNAVGFSPYRTSHTSITPEQLSEITEQDFHLIINNVTNQAGAVAKIIDTVSKLDSGTLCEA